MDDTTLVRDALRTYAETMDRSAKGRYNAGEHLKKAREGLRANRDQAYALDALLASGALVLEPRDV